MGQINQQALTLWDGGLQIAERCLRAIEFVGNTGGITNQNMKRLSYKRLQAFSLGFS